MEKNVVERIIQFLNEKWQKRPCPMCGVGNWSVQDRVFELREFRGGSLVVGGTPIMPIIPVICNNCGNTILINAKTTGFVIKEKVDKDE
ncbi:MAG: hypothetical protein H0Z29_10795 [Candidatus Marinimicrobia bacterium]|nr:hypothetical protein [Candidatus Neomarinimicrobiota bacterium]